MPKTKKPPKPIALPKYNTYPYRNPLEGCPNVQAIAQLVNLDTFKFKLSGEDWATLEEGLSRYLEEKSRCG